MKLVQKILSHGLFITVIVVAFLVYTKRADLFPQWFGASHAAAARSTGDKVASAGADVGTLPPARTVTRPLPEKTLSKKQVVPPAPVPEKVNPTGTETAPPGQQQPAGSDTAAPAPSEPAVQPPAGTAPAGAGAASGATGTDTASARTAGDDTSAQPQFRPLDDAQQAQAASTGAPAVAAPQFRPLDDKQQAEKPAASTDTPAAAAPQFRPLDDEQRAEKPAASTDMPAAAKAAQAAARNSEPVAVEPQQRGTQEQAAQEQAAQEAAPEQAAQEQAAQEQAAQEQAAQEQTAPEQAAPAAQPQVATAMPRARPGPAVESPAVAEPQISAEDARLQQQLGQAREFYWSRDLRGAAAAYQSLGEAYPDNAEVWGEIGNFYFSLRRSEQAGAAYSHAIELLMQNNDPVRARQLLGVLFRLDARKARELETRLQQAGG
jgi:hypothetical protein